MPTRKPIVGLSFNADQFDSYCHSIQWTAWRRTYYLTFFAEMLQVTLNERI